MPRWFQRGARPEEVAVVRAFLEQPGDPRGAKLVEQVAQAPRMQRSAPSRSAYELRLPHTHCDVVDLPVDFASEWRTLHDETSGTPLQFCVEVGRSGIFRVLRGRTAAAAWPRRWSIGARELAAVPPSRLPAFVPATECLERLAPLVGERPADRRGLRLGCTDPAGEEALARVEAEQGAPLPPAYRAFLGLTDGLLLGGELLGGTQDVYVVELDGAEWWLIASLYGVEFLVTAVDQERDGAAVLLWPHDAGARGDAQRVAEDFEGFLRGSLAAGRLLGT